MSLCFEFVLSVSMRLWLGLAKPASETFTNIFLFLVPHHSVCSWKQILNIVSSAEIKHFLSTGLLAIPKEIFWVLFWRTLVFPIFFSTMKCWSEQLMTPFISKTGVCRCFQNAYIYTKNRRIAYLISVCPPAFRAIWTSSFPYLSSACALLKEKFLSVS